MNQKTSLFANLVAACLVATYTLVALHSDFDRSNPGSE
jgi:hypothetical protein